MPGYVSVANHCQAIARNQGRTMSFSSIKNKLMRRENFWLIYPGLFFFVPSSHNYFEFVMVVLGCFAVYLLESIYVLIRIMALK
jgi:hypothetical protein